MSKQPNFKSKDFYENLGLSKDADTKAIKKAYHKLSLKHHPDKNPNNKEESEEIFKIISYAYQVLSDPQKRQDYDTYGREYLEQGGIGTRNGGGGGGFGGGGFHHAHFNMQSANDIFRSFFGGKDPFADFFDDDDDFFSGGFGGGFGGMHKQGKGSRKMRDPF